MATTMDWATGIFTVYQSDMVFISGKVYELDVEALMRELSALQWAGRDGITFLDIFTHNTELTIGITTYVRALAIINGYTMAISPTGDYQVSCKGANHNLGDVYNNGTGPTLLPNNSAGLVNNPTPATPAAAAAAVWDSVRTDHETAGSMGKKLGRTLSLATEADGVAREVE